MRFFGQDTPTPILQGYLTSPLPANTIEKVQFDFASTADEQVRLAIHDDAEFYGKTAEEIRRALEARNPAVEDFLLVGEDVVETDAVWYVGEWVTDEEFENEMVQRSDQPVVWRMRVMVKAAPSRWIDYSIANSSIQEDIDSTVDTWPCDLNAPARAFGQDEFPRQSEPDRWRPPAYVIADPGEWEEGPGNLMDVDPPQERVYRLKKEVAEQYGLRNDWAIGWRPEAGDDGSMCFAQSYL
ncbi:hypothetical protein K469DRAFT_686998 [Zopfia rhizophila CBS 207.26]|uniref:Uncharacterized protein n=1 Tax=Zopfia rhizophila CBS 207.26 TaxID=1314779 RepID=A0A6A6E3X0_9PEZI|nr:hypothetical protein K469DRAFT_686998 [Zopfia rhizophila CBS 207.26]